MGKLALGAGALLGGIGGAMPQTSNSIQGVDLRKRGAFESYLTGSSGGLSEAERRQLDTLSNELKNVQNAVDPLGNNKGKIDSLKKQIANINANASRKGRAGAIESQYKELASLVGQGPGSQDVTASLDASRSLAAMLGDYSKSGGLPGSEDISTANQFTNDIFAAQQEGLNQQFNLFNQDAARQAALSGRGSSDPILRSRLMETQFNAQNMLNAQKTGFSANFAQNLPMQRLGFAGQQADVLSGLASQAMTNRASLFGLGQSALNNERNWRYTISNKTGQNTSGGGLGGAITGALGGAGAAAGIMGALQGANIRPPQGGGTGGMPSAPYSYGGMAGPSLPGGGFMSGGGYTGTTSIFSAFPNFPGAGTSPGYYPGAPLNPSGPFGYMGALRAY